MFLNAVQVSVLINVVQKMNALTVAEMTFYVYMYFKAKSEMSHICCLEDLYNLLTCL